jgi:putative ABC transport system permease protein
VKFLRVTTRRLVGLFGGDRHDAELREELESLAALQLEQDLAAGIPPAEARRRVIERNGGSITGVTEAVREQRGLAWLESLWRDVRMGARLLRRNPLFAATAVLSLALGIGANAAIFSIIDHLLLRALPVRHADRLLMLDGGSFTYPIWEQVKLRAGEFDGAGAWANEEMTVRVGATGRREQGIFVSGGFFELLGVTPVLGRTIDDADDRRGGGANGPVAVISDAYWERAFGRDPDVLGRTVIVDRVPFTIVGVTPRPFFGPEVGRSFTVAIPFGTEPLLRGSGSTLDERRNWWLNILVRRRVEQTEAQVQSAMAAMTPAVREATRTPDPNYLSEPLRVVPAEQGRSVLRGQYRDALYILMAASVVVLLVTCANVANLLLARATTRRGEMSVRLAIGGSRWRLVRQLLAESAVLSVLGVAVGLLVAVATARVIVSQLSTSTAPVMLDVALDWRLALFATVVACLVTPLFAVLPALKATRVEPGAAMKEQSRTVAGDGGHALGQTLVLGQIALSLSLVVLAGLLVGTFTKLASRPLGLDSRRVVVAEVRMLPDAVPAEERTALFDRLKTIVNQVPGVAATALTTKTPASGSGWNSGVVDVDGTDVGGDGRQRMVWMSGVTDGFFATYGIEIRAGRDVSAGDTAAAPPVMIVNEAFVRRFLGSGPAIGRRVRQGLHDRPDTYSEYREIVGVVADTVYRRDLRRDFEPTVFLPMGQLDGPPRESINVAARSRADDAAALVAAIAQAVDGADSRITSRVAAHQVYVHNALTQERLIATVAGLFGGLALVLAVVGLYGVTAYTVSRRRAEIGVRLALGATPRRVVQLVLQRVAVLVAAGVVVGVGISLWAGRAVRVLLHGLEPNDPTTLFGAAAVLLVTGGLAGVIPAWRAARTDPAAALRQ